MHSDSVGTSCCSARAFFALLRAFFVFLAKLARRNDSFAIYSACVSSCTLGFNVYACTLCVVVGDYVGFLVENKLHLSCTLSFMRLCNRIRVTIIITSNVSAALISFRKIQM